MERPDSPLDPPLKITPDELDRAVPLSMRGFARPVACPVCGIMNDGAAIECRSCGEPFAKTGPGGRKRTFVPRRPPEEIQAVRWTATGLFVASLVGVLAPAVIVLGVLLVARRRLALAQAGPAFVALAGFAIGVSVLYSAMALWALLC